MLGSLENMLSGLTTQGATSPGALMAAMAGTGQGATSSGALMAAMAGTGQGFGGGPVRGDMMGIERTQHESYQNTSAQSYSERAPPTMASIIESLGQGGVPSGGRPKRQDAPPTIADMMNVFAAMGMDSAQQQCNIANQSGHHTSPATSTSEPAAPCHSAPPLSAQSTDHKITNIPGDLESQLFQAIKESEYRILTEVSNKIKQSEQRIMNKMEELFGKQTPSQMPFQDPKDHLELD